MADVGDSSASSRSEGKKTKKKSTSSVSSESSYSEEVKSPKSPKGESQMIIEKTTMVTKKTEVVQNSSYEEVNGVNEKSSFSNRKEESRESSPVEEVKLSVDKAKVQRQFSQSKADGDKVLCKICGTHVYQMERIKAEKNAFHKNCFRCKECNKLLTVDTYMSHEGEIFCKPHFKQLFQPKAHFEEDAGPRRPRKHEMIIRENVPEELPPDVVRSETKADDGLESLNLNLTNIRSRFESPQDEHQSKSAADGSALQRSESIVKRLEKYQSAVSGEQRNGDVYSSDSEDEDRDPSVIRETKSKEKVVFGGMSSLKDQWESGNVNAVREGGSETKKEALADLRKRICLGRSESMKQVYQKAVEDANKISPSRPDSLDLKHEMKATLIKEKFETGEVIQESEAVKISRLNKEKEEDFSVFAETGIAHEAKNIFKQIDAEVSKQSVQPLTSPTRSPRTDSLRNSFTASENGLPPTGEIVKCTDPTNKDDIEVETTELTERFKFFENFKEDNKEKKRFQITPPREIRKEESPEPALPRDPNVVRALDSADDIPVTDTARKMTEKFRQLELEADSQEVPTGPKPLKRITPPREYTKVENHESSPEPDRDPEIVRCSYKVEDEIQVEADKAKSIRARFENWEAEVARENKKNEAEEEDFLPQADTTKNLKAKFEAIKEESTRQKEKPKPRVNRFVEFPGTPQTEACSICNKKLYPMEKMEASGLRLHKNCFRCAHCSCMLRLENYTISGGKLYCTPHFKQFFIAKGNYDEGFGREKWNRSSSPATTRDNAEEYTNGDREHLGIMDQAVIA